MEANRQAYEVYRNACESYGMEAINFDYFITYLTEEQLDEYRKKAIN